MKASDELGALAEALAKAQGAISGAKADSKGHNHKYASLSACWDGCRQQLSSNGLSIVQGLTAADGVLTCTTRLLHSSGQWVEDSLSMPVEESRGMSLAQSVGSIGTYARRYGLCALVGITPDDDLDQRKPEPVHKRHASQPKERPAVADPGTIRAEQASGKAKEAAASASSHAKKAAAKADPNDNQHHVSFGADRVKFMAVIGDIGWKYDDLCAFLEWAGGKRPSSMTSAARAKLVARMQEPDEAWQEKMAAFEHFTKAG